MSIKPKYRALTKEELTGLENEFVEFLILNGIIASEWEQLKSESPDKAEDLLILFSDVVFEKILREVRFLEKRLPKELMIFQCLQDQMVLVGISSDSVDFTNTKALERAVRQPPSDAQVFTTEKKYHQVREAELYKMLESGCTISDGKLFKTLSVHL